jgi:hypothetical protein
MVKGASRVKPSPPTLSPEGEGNEITLAEQILDASTMSIP